MSTRHVPTPGDLVGIDWHVSSWSPDTGGNCVEAGALRDRVVVRDSKNRDGGVLVTPGAAWCSFASAAAHNRFAPSANPRSF